MQAIAATIPSGNSTNDVIGTSGTTAQTDSVAAALAQSQASVHEVIKTRVWTAFGFARDFAMARPDPEYTAKLMKKLSKSHVKGSWVNGVTTPDEVDSLFAVLQNWTHVTDHRLHDIEVFQAEIPVQTAESKRPGEATHQAYAAYATLKEIREQYGKKGLQYVQIREGNQETGDQIYHLTHLKMPTRVITVHLKKDETGKEFLLHWFAGREVTTYNLESTKDNIVRMDMSIAPDTGHGGPRVQRRNG